jgi:hypothetical protein
MLAIKGLNGPETVDIYQCPEGKTAVVYIDIYMTMLITTTPNFIEIAIAEWNNEFNDYDYWTYWRGYTDFVSLGPIWLDSKDKIVGWTSTIGVSANCFVHGKEF